ncbi:hypothetical protein LH128_01057 [Sphingomonas sp. LH128]|uniref:hypothetical protein n=1 Tax=Sphingomonas sp. LH128 TaxID=473781 RepID=UPI00027CC1EB|nr:hypothetical protein [Sphingomonas sp. LH128]EJU14921.1 hypothetical protein LH128_01057 [Sphingomonas sp. LH128]
MELSVAAFSYVAAAFIGSLAVFSIITFIVHLLLPKGRSAEWKANWTLAVLMVFTAILYVGEIGLLSTLGSLAACVAIWAGYRQLLRYRSRTNV